MVIFFRLLGVTRASDPLFLCGVNKLSLVLLYTWYIILYILLYIPLYTIIYAIIYTIIYTTIYTIILK